MYLPLAVGRKKKDLSNKALTIFTVVLLCLSIFPLWSIPLANEADAQPISESRWISENTYQVKSGTVEIYSGSMAFMNTSTGRFDPIDTAIQQNSTHYYAVKGIYQIYISKNLSVPYPFVINRGNSSLMWKPVNAGYIDKSKYKIQILRNINASAKVVVNYSTITYSQLFGRNIDFRITVGTDVFKEELLINHALVSSLPSPSIYGMLPENTFIGVISRYQLTSLNLSSDTGNFSTTDGVNMTSGGNFKLRLPPSSAWDSQTDVFGTPNNTVAVRNIFTRNSERRIGSGVPYNWIIGTRGTVTIDPTTTIQPSSADTYLYQIAPTTNYGSATSLFVYSCYIDPDSYNARSLVDFDISSIPSSAKILSANTSLYEYNLIGVTSRTYWIYRNTRTDWVESQATWNIYKTGNSWTTAGGDYVTTHGASLSLSGIGWKMWNTTLLISDFLGLGSSKAQFLIKDASESNPDCFGKYFYSREYAGDTSLRPKLTVSYSAAKDLYVKALDDNGATITSHAYIGYNSSNIHQVNSSGWVKFTAINNNSLVNLNLNIWENSTSLNGRVKGNGSNNVQITMGAVDKQVVLKFSVYKVNLIFRDRNGSTVTPSNMSISFGHNSSVKTITSFTGFFVANYSNTPSKIYKWNSNTRLNSSDSFTSTSWNQTYQYNVKIIGRNPYWRDFDGHNISYSRLSSTYSILFQNGTSKTGLSTNTVYKMQNGSSTVTNPTWQSMNVTEGTRIFDPYQYKPNFTLAIENHTRAPSDFFGVNTTTLKVVLGSSPNYILKNNANISFSYSGGVVSISEAFVKPILNMTKQSQTSTNLTLTIQDSSTTDQWKLIWVGGGGGGNTTVTTTTTEVNNRHSGTIMLVFVLILGIMSVFVIAMRKRR